MLGWFFWLFGSISIMLVSASAMLIGAVGFGQGNVVAFEDRPIERASRLEREEEKAEDTPASSSSGAAFGGLRLEVTEDGLRLRIPTRLNLPKLDFGLGLLYGPSRRRLSPKNEQPESHRLPEGGPLPANEDSIAKHRF